MKLAFLVPRGITFVGPGFGALYARSAQSVDIVELNVIHGALERVLDVGVEVDVEVARAPFYGRLVDAMRMITVFGAVDFGGVHDVSAVEFGVYYGQIAACCLFGAACCLLGCIARIVVPVAQQGNKVVYCHAGQLRTAGDVFGAVGHFTGADGVALVEVEDVSVAAFDQLEKLFVDDPRSTQRIARRNAEIVRTNIHGTCCEYCICDSRHQIACWCLACWRFAC